MGYVDSDVHLQNPCGVQRASVRVLTRILSNNRGGAPDQSRALALRFCLGNRPRYAGLPRPECQGVVNEAVAQLSARF